VNHEFRALEDLYASWVVAMREQPNLSIAEIRSMFEHWGDVTAEPRGIDYSEVDADGVEAMWVRPQDVPQHRVLLCCHGGGYIVGSMYSHRKLFGHFAKTAGCAALVLNYRRAPESPHPGPVNDVVRAYRWLLNSIESRHVAFLGDSAGGGLAITALLRSRELHLPLPAASIALSPYLDMEMLGSTYETNAGKDVLGSREGASVFVSMFLGAKGDRRDPLANPLYAILQGLPPILIQAAGDDMLLDDSLRFHSKALAAGVDVTLHVAPNTQHVYQFMAGASERADQAVAAAAAWVRPKLGLN